MIKFPSIKSFRNTIEFIRNKFYFSGLDNENNPIFDNTKILPVIKYVGSIKLHGTNSAIRITRDGNYLFQSRNQIVAKWEDGQKNNHFYSLWFSKLYLSKI